MRWFLLGTLCLVAGAIYLLPGWLALLIAGLPMLALGAFARRVLSGGAVELFKLKGAPLQGAKVTVHSIAPVERPDPSSWWDEQERLDDQRRRYFRVDATISPRATLGPFRHWAPDELILMRPGMSMADDEEDDAIRIHEIQVVTNDQIVDLDFDKWHGKLRIVLTIGVTGEVSKACFHYYFHSFGELEFPSAEPSDRLQP